MAKSQVEVQFNWIFVLIVGGIILTFFVMVIAQQRKGAEVGLTGEVLTALEKLITDVTISDGTYFLIKMPSVPIVYNCDESCICTITSENAPLAGIDVKSIPIFAPNSLKGQRIVPWSRPFNAPFRAVNFFYMTSPQARYIIEDTATGEQVYDTLPPLRMVEEGQTTDEPALTKELFDPTKISEIQDLNSYKVKFIMFNTDPKTFAMPPFAKAMADDAVTAIEISEATSEVTFYKKGGFNFIEQGKTKYLDDASMYGAIFAEDVNQYSCMMDIAFKHLNVVGQVYALRAQTMRDKYGTTSTCTVYYDSFYLDQILSVTSSGFRSNNQLASLGESIRNLESQNKNTLLFSCAPIY